jgi:2-oxoglutarate dehydrogenase E2 component (dihydrolipoamide succinyltransferase)
MDLEIKVPPVGESITEVTLSRWAKKEGDFVQMDEIIAELESDKATFELTAEKSGTLHLLVSEGDTVPVGNLVATLNTDGVPEPAKIKEEPRNMPDSQSPKEMVVPSANSDSYAKGFASPSASKVLAEKGLEGAQINGSGRDGRITLADAQNAQAPPKSSASPVNKEAQDKNSSPVLMGDRSVRVEKLSNLRKTIGKRLVAVKNETAMLTTFNEVDMQPIMDLRSRYKDKFKEKYEVGLGFMSFFTRAVCEALKEFPAVNAQINGDEITYHQYVDISIAVSAPKGLVVPVIRNAQSLSFAQIEKSIVELASKARESKLSIEEMTGGTFSITNGGVFGSMLSTPILNPPQSAILGMHNIVERAVVIAGKIEIRPIMYLALSYDHRIIDGRESVSFLVKVKQYLEDPGRLLLGI